MNNDNLKNIVNDMEMRYFIRQKTQLMSGHSELAVEIWKKIVECLDGKAAMNGELIALLEAYIVEAEMAANSAKSLLDVVRKSGWDNNP